MIFKIYIIKILKEEKRINFILVKIHGQYILILFFILNNTHLKKFFFIILFHKNMFIDHM